MRRRFSLDLLCGIAISRRKRNNPFRRNIHLKTGLVLEGGALRGVFTCGILDCFIENGISFQYVIGVSAGAGNAINFLAGQKHRTFDVSVPDKKYPYYGMRRFLQNGKILDLDRMFYEYPVDQYPFDFDTYFSSGIENEFVTVNCETGCAEYMSGNSDRNRLMTVGKASCSVPMLCPPVEIDGSHYLDGSVADPVPFERAFEKGCDRAVVIMTKKEGEPATDYKKYKVLISSLYKKKYPKLYEALLTRKERYDKQAQLMKEYIKDGKILLIRPEVESVSKFERNRDRLQSFWDHGYKLANDNIDAIRDFVNGN